MVSNQDATQQNITKEDSVPELEPKDDSVRMVAYAVGTAVHNAAEALAPTHPGWAAYFRDLYEMLDNEFSA